MNSLIVDNVIGEVEGNRGGRTKAFPGRAARTLRLGSRPRIFASCRSYQVFVISVISRRRFYKFPCVFFSESANAVFTDPRLPFDIVKFVPAVLVSPEKYAAEASGESRVGIRQHPAPVGKIFLDVLCLDCRLNRSNPSSVIQSASCGWSSSHCSRSAASMGANSASISFTVMVSGFKPRLLNKPFLARSRNKAKPLSSKKIIPAAACLL